MWSGVLLFKRRLAGLLMYSLILFCDFSIIPCAFCKTNKRLFTKCSLQIGRRFVTLRGKNKKVSSPGTSISIIRSADDWLSIKETLASFVTINYTDASCRLGDNCKIVSDLRMYIKWEGRLDGAIGIACVHVSTRFRERGHEVGLPIPPQSLPRETFYIFTRSLCVLVYKGASCFI